MTGFSSPRRTAAQIKFNGKSVTKRLKPYLESVTYTDVASGDSDQLDLTFFNLEMKWLDKWFPQKGDKVSGSLVFQNWKKGDAKRTLTIGSFVLDDISFSGGPLSAKFGCVAVPNHESFRIRERTKTWEDVRIEGIAKEIASRYDLKLKYKADNIKIKSLEQSNATDCSFLYKTCENYGLAMKVFFDSIIIYDQTDLEKKKAVSTIAREDFVDDSWTFNDTLAGIYTGARISYKSGSNNDEISVYLGFKKEDARGSRVLKINETADNLDDAYHKAAAQVNKSNQEATTLTGRIFPDPKICAGVCVKVTGLGKIDGKYFVDKSKIDISESGTTQEIEMHKCQKRLKPKPV